MGFNLGDFLFGSEPKLETQQLSTLTPKQGTSLNDLLNWFTQQGGAGATPTAYGGNLTSKTSNLENLSLAALEQFAMQQAGGGSDLQKTTESTLQDLLSGKSSDVSSFFQTNIEDPALKSFQEKVLPGISRSYGGSDFFSSSRMDTDRMAQQELIDSLTRSRSDVELKARESALDRSLGAAGLVNPYLSGRTGDLMQAMAAGGIPRSVEEGNIARQYGEFQRQEEEKNRRVSEILAALGVTGVENIGAALPGAPGFITELIGAFMGGGGSFRASPGAASKDGK